ncbi:MAG: hypothetical protein BV456_01025 [Thermoplasmata archaeon M8B2D]|nr:MAG: hypothetical protein BV456_01025 [Thermoplasmata archaeon M8B2D]
MQINDQVIGGNYTFLEENQVLNELQNIIRNVGLTPESSKSLTGTSSSSGTTITGSGTLFTTELKVGDLFYETSKPPIVRRVVSIASDTSLTIASAFPDEFSGVACSILNTTQILSSLFLLISTSNFSVLKFKEKQIISSSVSSFEITDLDPTKSYLIEISELSVNTGNTDLLYTASDDNGSSYKSTGYYGAGFSNGATASTLAGLNQNNTSSLIMNSQSSGIESAGVLTNACLGIKIHLFRSDNRLNKFVAQYVHDAPITNLEGGTIAGGVRNTDINAVKFAISSGMITNAIIEVYEFNK